jgi:hypothetical protein
MPNKKKWNGYQKTQPKTWSMYPDKHQEVLALLEEDHVNLAFRNQDDIVNCLKEYDTKIMGRFVCHNKTCNSPGWGSKKIAITIRKYRDQKYNARVYHQRCLKCNVLSKPILDSSYPERVAYRLKKWAGVYIEPPPYNSRNNQKPHESEFCEGCKAGRCQDGLGRDWD